MNSLISTPKNRQEIIIHFGLTKENAAEEIKKLKSSGKVIESKMFIEPTKSNKKKRVYFVTASNLSIDFYGKDELNV